MSSKWEKSKIPVLQTSPRKSGAAKANVAQIKRDSLDASTSKRQENVGITRLVERSDPKASSYRAKFNSARAAAKMAATKVNEVAESKAGVPNHTNQMKENDHFKKNNTSTHIREHSAHCVKEFVEKNKAIKEHHKICGKAVAAMSTTRAPISIAPDSGIASNQFETENPSIPFPATQEAKKRVEESEDVRHLDNEFSSRSDNKAQSLPKGVTEPESSGEITAWIFEDDLDDSETMYFPTNLGFKVDSNINELKVVQTKETTFPSAFIENSYLKSIRISRSEEFVEFLQKHDHSQSKEAVTDIKHIDRPIALDAVISDPDLGNFSRRKDETYLLPKMSSETNIEEKLPTFVTLPPKKFPSKTLIVKEEQSLIMKKSCSKLLPRKSISNKQIPSVFKKEFPSETTLLLKASDIEVLRTKPSEEEIVKEVNNKKTMTILKESNPSLTKADILPVVLEDDECIQEEAPADENQSIETPEEINRNAEGEINSELRLETAVERNELCTEIKQEKQRLRKNQEKEFATANQIANGHRRINEINSGLDLWKGCMFAIIITIVAIFSAYAMILTISFYKRESAVMTARVPTWYESFTGWIFGFFTRKAS